MKRLIAFLVFIVVAGVVAFLLTTFPANRETIFPGYMEADLVLDGGEDLCVGAAREEGADLALAVLGGGAQGDAAWQRRGVEGYRLGGLGGEARLVRGDKVGDGGHGGGGGGAGSRRWFRVSGESLWRGSVGSGAG